MTDTPQTPENRPLVTFALFAYNQEQYIREAVEGAFAQTYEPLEIILSDDCSSDRTFEIMQEMAAAYEGPHDVRARRCEVNLGLIGHVNDVAATMHGSILILAAGDDISLPSRTERLVKIFSGSPNVVLAHSNAFVIDDEGVIIGEKNSPPAQVIDKIMTSASIYIGATGAISRRLIYSFDPIHYRATYEDLIFGARAALIGEIVQTDERLVKYRADIGIIFKSKNAYGRLERRRRRIIHRIETLRQRKIDIEKSLNAASPILLELVERELLKELARSHFHNQRISFIYGLFGRSFMNYLKAASSEIKYLSGFIQ